jgi:hypothetical protein
MWIKLLQYILPAVAVILVLLWVENRGYDRGHAAAEKTCREVTVPAAEAAVQTRCDVLTNATKEENDALSRDADRLRATYERLRRQKPTAACVPIADYGAGDAGTDAPARPVAGMGVSTEWLDEAFYDAASDISRGQSCQRQLARIYELNRVAK